MKVLKGCAWGIFVMAALAVILFVVVVVANLYNLGKSVSNLDATETSGSNAIAALNCHEAQTSVAMIRSIHAGQETETVSRLRAVRQLGTAIPGPVTLTVAAGEERVATASAAAYNMFADPRGADAATAAARC